MHAVDPFQINFETLVAASPMLGHKLENRSRIRQQQSLPLWESLLEASSVPLDSPRQLNDFVVAPLDVLVSREQGRAQFHILELNGTGIGGVSNMPSAAVAAVASTLRRVAASCREPRSTLLLPVSGKECASAPRLNKLIHEKLIFAEALQAGLADAGGRAEIVTLDGLRQGTQSLPADGSAVVLGYIKDFLDACQLDPRGRITLAGRPVTGAVNDRFCLNLLSKFRDAVDLDQFRPINGTYLAGGDKGVAYSLLDQHLASHASEAFPARVDFAHACSRRELIEAVLNWLRSGRRPVIKPHGTGIGDGIEFFLDRWESVDSIIRRIDDSILGTEQRYSAAGGAFPYTLCEFVESELIAAPGHRFDGHKYELRIVVYNDAGLLRACPTIAKVAGEPFSAAGGRAALINNITSSAVANNSDGTDHMLPLCNLETLELLNLRYEELAELCRVATRYVRHVVHEIPRAQEHFCRREEPVSRRRASHREALPAAA